MTKQSKTQFPSLKVATLNICNLRNIGKSLRGIRLFNVSKNLDVRIKFLIDKLNDKETDFDIVALQEVWSYDDVTHIKESIKKNYPYSHHFKSGLNGSGCCIFSRHFIEDVFYHKYSLNGYPHRIFNGDWFGGKLVGLAKIQYHGLIVNVYTTHLHANYSDTYKENPYNDEYLAHRMTQLFELSQFIHNTSSGADMTLLMGDLNTDEFESGYKLLLHHARLSDAFTEKTKTAGNKQNGATCYTIDNCYGLSPSRQKYFQDGIRIDYVLFKSRSTLNVQCADCSVCFGKINPHLKKGLNYSDHEGVCAEFSIAEAAGENEVGFQVEPYARVKCIIDKCERSVYRHQLAYLCSALVLLLALFWLNQTAFFGLYFSVGSFFSSAFNLVAGFIIFYLLVHGIVMKTAERNHLHYTSSALELAMQGKRLQD